MISWVTMTGGKRNRLGCDVVLSYLLEGRWLILTTAPSECSSDELDAAIPNDEVGASMLAPDLPRRFAAARERMYRGEQEKEKRGVLCTIVG
jgi:hypothetical protein